MHPPNDDYVPPIEAAVRALVDGERVAGERALQPIAYPPRSFLPRPAIRAPKAALIIKRDHFCCRYCGRKTIATPIMVLLGSLYPASFPYHPDWKAGLTHPAAITRSPVVDHLVPGAWGGDWTDDENLVTACWPCNSSKADLTLEQLGWPPIKPIPDTDWDGLISLYRRLWIVAGSHQGTRTGCGLSAASRPATA